MIDNGSEEGDFSVFGCCPDLGGATRKLKIMLSLLTFRHGSGMCLAGDKWACAARTSDSGHSGGFLGGYRWPRKTRRDGIDAQWAAT